jgi:hypothetical protein
MFKCLVSFQGDFAKTVTSKLPQLTVLGFRASFKIIMLTKIYQFYNCLAFKDDIISSFRSVSHRLTNDLNRTMSGIYVEIIEKSVLQIKAIKYCSHLKLWEA